MGIKTKVAPVKHTKTTKTVIKTKVVAKKTKATKTLKFKPKKVTKKFHKLIKKLRGRPTVHATKKIVVKPIIKTKVAPVKHTKTTKTVIKTKVAPVKHTKTVKTVIKAKVAPVK